MLRDFLDDVLVFIDSESLTDDEYASVGAVAEEYNKASYDALKAVLQDRDGVSGQLAKLASYYTAKGVDLSGTTVRAPASQIFVGSPL